MASHISLGIQDFGVCLTVETDLKNKQKKHVCLKLVKYVKSSQV